jgi:cytidine deaminase
VSAKQDEVPADLLHAARQAFANAYAPYSGFRVGAALRAEDGTIFAGANVENSSFGLTRCAEQSAVQALISSGRRQFDQVVVYTAADQPASPCGACRQILFEFAPGASVLLVNAAGAVVRTSVEELLPLGFRLHSGQLPT